MRTVIEMAEACGVPEFVNNESQADNIMRFAALIRADEQKKWEDQTMIEINEAVIEEREACAKVCDDIDAEYEGEDVLATWCASAIRARGEKT